MQETREIEQVGLLLDTLGHLWLYGIRTLGRNNLLDVYKRQILRRAVLDKILYMMGLNTFIER